MYHRRLGTGKPLLLVHGLGSSWQTWQPVLDGLAARRQVIAVDLPGFGETPPMEGELSIATLADALTEFIDDQGLHGVDLLGSSVGARLVLELARRHVGGHVVALDPGGFWTPRQLRFFGVSIKATISLVRVTLPASSILAGNAVSRSALLAQLSAKPWALASDLVAQELRSWARAPGYDALLDALLHGPDQAGSPRGSLAGRVVIGWGRQDRVVTPSQAATALARFPDAELHWFDSCGHFPMWDQPAETVRLVLESTA